MSRVTAHAFMLGPRFVQSTQSARRLCNAFICLTAVTLASVATAHAGRYHDYTCRTPSGEAAPADGWSASVAKNGTYDQFTKNTCAEGGALIAALGEETTHPAFIDLATWTYEVPASESLVGATVYRASRGHFRSGDTGTYGMWLAGSTIQKTFDECSSINCGGHGAVGSPLSPANRIAVPSGNLGARMYVNAGCAGGPEGFCGNGFGDPSGYAAALYLYAADFVLEQTEGPSVREASGPLASDQPLYATSDLTFRATDPGAGVYQAFFYVDGNVVQSTVVNENGGHCRNVGQTTDGLPAFLYVQPCLRSLTADVGFETTRVSNGTHHLIVMVSDAAGNTTTVLDRSVLVENKTRGACNAECDEHAVLHAAKALLLVRTLTRRYANSGLPLTGQLVDSAGSPMKGAVVELDQQANYLGARSVPVATTTTDANGRWRLRVPKGPSRVLTVGYRSHANDPAFAAQLQYRETVGAGVRLSAPRHARAGEAFAFRGYLAGGYIPREGALVSLEIYYAGEWREIALLRTNRRGAFAYRYTFGAIGPATYRFRAQLPQTVGYPFASAASRSSYIHLAG